MSFEFQSTLVDITPSYRIKGSEIGGVRLMSVSGIRVARVIVTSDSDVQFALTGPFEEGDPDLIYASLAEDLVELVDGVLINPSSISKLALEDEEVRLDLRGDDRPFRFKQNANAIVVSETADHTWSLPTALFNILQSRTEGLKPAADNDYSALQTRIEQLEDTVQGLQITLTAINEGLVSGTLSAQSLNIG